ncbi:50S ribosomal protein L22, partial [Patescibacteria group bacterium]
MQVTAKLKHLRVASRKVRLVADLIRGLSVVDAEKQLKFLNNRSVLPIEKLLKSAVSNAENNAKLVKENLYISKIVVDEGPILKRWRARSMGRAAEIMKRTSHIAIVLDEVSPGAFKKSVNKVK